MSLPGEAFTPPARLRNPHIQSIYPSLPFRRPGVERRCRTLLEASQDLVLDCASSLGTRARGEVRMSSCRYFRLEPIANAKNL